MRVEGEDRDFLEESWDWNRARQDDLKSPRKFKRGVIPRSLWGVVERP